MKDYNSMYNKQEFLLKTLIEDCNNCGYTIKTIHMGFEVTTVTNEDGECMSLKFDHIDNTWL